jgi:glycosyltransferase involved in cell wall biosynthesis
MVESEVVARNMAIAFALGRQTKHEIYLYTPQRVSIDRGRNEAAKIALDTECKYIWFLDDDMVINPGTLNSLIAAKRDIVMAHSYIRGYPYKPMCFRWKNKEVDKQELEYFENDQDLYDLADDYEYCDVAAVGFTCTLVKVDILKKILPPFFITNPNGGGTEDIYFCMRCHNEIKKPISVAVDLNCPTIHLGDREHITRSTVEHLRTYHEGIEPSLCNQKSGREAGDRAKEYHEECLQD